MTDRAANSSATPTVITLCPGGPMLVRGPVEMRDADGTVIPLRRSTVALCRCGKTAIAPFCDGTHKLLRPPRPAADDQRDPPIRSTAASTSGIEISSNAGSMTPACGSPVPSPCHNT